MLKLLGDDFRKLYDKLPAEERKDFLGVAKSFLPKDPGAKNYQEEVKDTVQLLELLIKTRLNIIESTKILADYIRQNKMPFASTLSKLVREHQFVLFGETHLDKNYNTPAEFIKALSLLKKETEERGEKLILAVEFDIAFQDLVENIDNPEKFKEEYLKIFPQSQKEAVSEVVSDNKITKEEFRKLFINAKGHLPDIVFEAKKLGIKVLSVDYLPYFHKGDVKDDDTDSRKIYEGITPVQAQRRDTKMFDLTVANIDPKTRIIFYGGSFHTSEEPVTDSHWGKIETLGTKLRKEFGDEKVISIRSVDHASGFNGMSNWSSIIVLNDTNRLPLPQSVMSALGEKNILIVPSGGLITTNEGHHDYVVIDTKMKSE